MYRMNDNRLILICFCQTYIRSIYIIFLCRTKALVEGKNFTPRTAFEKVVHDPNIEDSPAADKAADVVGDEEL